MKKHQVFITIGISSIFLACAVNKRQAVPQSEPDLRKQYATINDDFWSPRFETWRTTTANDVLNKFEGLHLDISEREKNNAFANFDRIASGNKGKGEHAGLPWFDGLIYESIRGIGDLLKQKPDAALEARIDKYIDRIYAAQQADPDGYINTYTDLMEPAHRWGDNGGFLRFQHDVYNAGMLVEAGVHYYQATGKTKLLEIATKFTNHMCELMGPAPKRNIIPAHAGPEEAVMKLYWLYKHNPKLKGKINVPVNEQAYYNLVRFWIENRGNHAGYPLWAAWGNDKAERWIKDQQYKNSANQRPSWGDYAQDSVSVFKQQTIEGHAVRATLLATAITAVAQENNAPEYRQTASRLWDNMAGQRMFVTGGVGAIHDDEKFGADYFLPTDAYLETCAAVGAGFFSQRMNELTNDAKYMDEFERVLYNNVLTGISLSGKQYTYQNPLNAHDHSRWEWHSCPCCPPMFLKMVSSLPEYIYAASADDLFVNLFIGSQSNIELAGNTIAVTQTTDYPWKGKISLKIDPAKQTEFRLNIRSPGWAQGKENPFDLYKSNLKSSVKLSINGQAETVALNNGYAVISRKWKKGDLVDLELPMQARLIKANEKVNDLRNMVALASGPIIYGIERADIENLESLKIDTVAALNTVFEKDMLGGVNIVSGIFTNGQVFKAVPYYAVGNRETHSYKVWLPLPQSAHITVNGNQVESKLSPLLYGSNIEDVNHEIYGGFYDQRVFGESFEEPGSNVNFSQWRRYTGYWTAKDDAVEIIPGRNTTSEVIMRGTHRLGVEPDHSAKLIYEPLKLADGTVEAEMKFTGKGVSGALLVRVANAGVGNDNFDGYEISLSRDGKKLGLGKHIQNFTLLKEVAVNVNAEAWNKIMVVFHGSQLEIFLNGQPVLSYNDEQHPLLQGHIGIRTWQSDMLFRNVVVINDGRKEVLKLVNPVEQHISYNWDIIQADGAQAVFNQSDTEAYNGKKSQVISYLSGSGKVGPVFIALESVDGSKTYAVKKINGIGSSWKKYPFNLTANATDRNARLTIYMTSKGKLWVDQVVLTGTGDDQFKGLPVRADIGNKLVEQGITFLRYKFKNMIGDPDKRPPYRGHWNWYSTNGFGIEEFLQFCEAASIVPCFAVNIYETPQDMADMVEYLNGDISTKWGAVRAKNGHPKPYGVKYIEIGNEEVLFNGDSKEAYEEYIERFNLLYEAMRKKDSTIEFVHSAWWRRDSPHMEMVFKAMNGKAAYWDLHVGGDDPQAGTETEKNIQEMLQRFKQWDPQTNMKIAVFEENGSKHGMQRALGHATNLNAIRRHNENILTSSPANALQPYQQNDNDWDQGQIFFASDQVWGMPPFYAQKMQAENHLPLLVKSHSDGLLDVTATRSEDGKTLVIHVVNTKADAIKTTIDLKGFEGRKPEAESFVLSGDLNAKNTPVQPEKYKTLTSKINFKEVIPVHEFPAHSYTILKFKR
jgi:DUF1680 family protein